MKRNISPLALYSEIAERANLRLKSMMERRIIGNDTPVAGYITIWRSGESSPCYKIKIGNYFSSPEFMKECYDNSDISIEGLIFKRQLNSGYVNSLQYQYSDENNVAIIFKNHCDIYALAVSGLSTPKDNFILAILAIAQDYNDLNDELMQKVIVNSGYEEDLLNTWNKIVAI